MSRQVYDVAVIGAGVFGSWIAYKLQREGRTVLLIDAFGAGNSRSSSGDESRIIRCGYGRDEIYSRMAMHSIAEWRELFGRARCPQLFQPTGVLWLAKKDDRYVSDSAKVLKKIGVEIEELSADELARRYPQFNCDGVDYAIFEPHSGALLGRRAVQAVCQAYIDAGGAFLIAKSAVPRITQAIDSISLESGEQIKAKDFVFACGPWLGKLFPDLMGSRLFVTRQEVFYFAAPSGNVFRSPSMPIWLHMDDQVYGFPDLENRGVKVAFDEHGPAFDPDSGERLVSADSLGKMRAYVANKIPVLANAPVAETRVCQYENTSNGDFILDRHPDAPNVWIAGGGSGHGFKHGPAVGSYMGSLIDGSAKVEPRFSWAGKESTQHRTVF